MRVILVVLAGVLIMMGASSRAEPTGASLAWTSDEPAIVEARSLILAGRLADAEARLVGPPTQAADEAREIIRRIRHEYAQDFDGVLRRLQDLLPDATAEDLRRWLEQGFVDHRVLDGRVAFFRREPSNLLRFGPEAKQRRKAHVEQQSAPERSPEWTLREHLRRVIDAGEAGGGPEVVPVPHRISYTLTIRGGNPRARNGSLARVWLPFPQGYRQQRGVRLVEASPTPPLLAPSAVDGRVIGGSPQRTAYFERTIVDPSQPLVFRIVFEYESSAYYPRLSDAQARPLPGDWGGAWLGERLPHIAFTPQARRLADEIVGDETNPLARARRIFHWVSNNIPWNAEIEYGLIPSLSEHGLSRRRGDCGVQTMVFITLCRLAGVPARWQSGWETKPVGWNMHDWCEIYIEPWGWLPCDPSYGLQDSEDPRIREFYLGHQDSYRLIGNLDYGSPLHPPKTSLRSEPADFQRGEVEIDGHNLYFNEWDWDIRFEWSETP